MKPLSTFICHTLLVAVCLTLCNFIHAQNYSWQLLGGVTGGVNGAGNGATIATDGINVYSAGYTVENPEFQDTGRLVVHVYNGLYKYWALMAVGPTYPYDTIITYSYGGNPATKNVQINSLCAANGGNLYIAGNFADGNYIMQWNPSTGELDSLGSAGISDSTFINSICTDGANVYEAGDNYIYMWNGSSWSQVGNQNLIFSSVLYAGTPGLGGALYANSYGSIYQWTGSSWIQLGISGYFFAGSPTGVIAALDPYGQYNVQYIQNNVTYRVPLPGQVTGFKAITADSNYIYISGQQGSMSVVEALAYGDSVWHILGTGGNALYYPAPVNAMCPYNGGIAITGTNVIVTSTFGGEEVVYYGPNIPGPLYVTLTKAQPNCSTPGSVTAMAQGGTPPYHYLWSDGNTDSIDAGLTPGTYYVTVQDAAGLTNTGYAQLDSGCFAYVTAFTYSDENNNCTYDAGDASLSKVLLTFTNQHGQVFYANSSSNGNLGIALPDTGYYYVHVISPSACARLGACSQANDTLHITSLHDTIALGNIAFLGGVDLTVLLNTSPATPGFNKYYEIIPFNLQAQPTPATVVFTYDSNLVYQAASGNPVVNTTAHTLTWAVNANQVYTGGGGIYPYILNSAFLVPSTLSITYQLQSNFTIMPYGGDCDTSNNSINVSEACTGSHDPNFKSVSPSGATSSTDSVLTYTIYFQNTGNDSTHFVTVVDTLSPYLQAATVRNIAGSAQYSSFNITGNGILTWVFNPYSLPDSTTDPVGSNGFITFSIKRAAQVPFDTAITNQASIYFDYNLPVQTNTATDTFICQIIPPVAVVTICPNDSFNFLGQWLYVAGNYTDTVVTTTGCDSIVTLTLTVTPAVTSTRTGTTCQGVPYNFNGRNLNTAGTYYDTLTAISTGCDSIVTLTLTVTPAVTSTRTGTTCAGVPYNFNGRNLSTTGTYYDTLTAISTGCDSIVTLTLTVTPAVTSTRTGTTCAGIPYNFNGRNVTATGTYYDTLTAISTGCDSIVTLTLTVTPAVTSTSTGTTCEGIPYNFNGRNLNSTGTYYDTLTAISSGCDSIVTLTLTVTPSVTSTRTDTTCAGVPYNFNGRNVTVAGTYYDTLTAISSGCDSIVTLNLTVNDAPVVTFSWDSLYAVHGFLPSVGGDSSIAFWCEPPFFGFLDTVPLSGGAPTGGVYSGFEVYNNVFRGDSFMTTGIWTYKDTVTYTYTDSFGCKSKASAFLDLGGCEGLNQITANNSITLYPNPATDQLFVKAEGINPQSISICDVDGRLITLQPFTPQININRLSSGVYFIEVASNEGVARKRFVKM